jgi:hypothetical protein
LNPRRRDIILETSGEEKHRDRRERETGCLVCHSFFISEGPMAGIAWVKDFQTAVSQAENSGKMVMADFFAPG